MIPKEDIQVDPDTQLVFNIPEENFEKLKSKLAKMSKKAEAQGLPSIFVMPIGFKDTKDANNRVHRTWEVMVAGIAPTIEGWVFNARIDYDREHGNVIYAIPGQSVPESYKNCGSICEHCNKARRRRTGYLLQQEVTGEFKLVGSSCLSEFFPQGSPETVAKYFETIRRAHRHAAGLAGPIVSFNNTSVELYLQAVAYTVRTQGWYSITRAREKGEPDRSTARQASILYTQSNFSSLIAQTDKENGTAAFEWLKGLSDSDISGNTFLHNVRTMAQDGLCKIRDETYVAGGYSAWLKTITPKNNLPNTNSSKHQGLVGDRLTLDVLVVNVFRKQDFSVHKLADSTGNVYTWFNHGSVDLKRDEWVRITGTVRAHNMFKGKEETVLTRVRESKNA